jgi:adenylate kinase family enzyme
MGKYSLENYEIYKTRKIRPVLLQTAPDNYGRGQITYIECSWAELEPQRGCYNLASVLDEVSKTTNPVLFIKPDYPQWMEACPEECFARLIRRAGSYLAEKEYHPIGVVISTISNSIVEWNAYLDGFPNTSLFADLHNHELIRYLKSKHQEFGLRITCSEDHWIECCEELADQSLQNNWERNPTLLHVLEDTCGAQVRKQAEQWHAGFSNKQLDLGYNIALRRLTYPEEVSGSGVLPARFWFVNNGSAPCYSELNIKIKLAKDKETYIISALNAPSGWPVGDIIHNEMIKLTDLKTGNYSLSVGLFHKHNAPVLMGIDQQAKDGFYKMGEIKIDDKNRDALKDVWDHYYPEGYYPLEDPQAPETSS